MSARPGTLASLKAAATNWRLMAVALQSFASGLPLGLVWIAMPTWLKYRQVDIRIIGLFSLTQAPWNFKFLWAPLMDRFSPGPLRRLLGRKRAFGRKRSWMLLTEMLLITAIVVLSRVAVDPRIGLVFLLGFLVAFSSASQDVVIDGYAVEVLEKEEFGKAVGARVAFYRVAMYLTSGVAITVGQNMLGWPGTYLLIACLFLPMMVVVWRSPEPAAVISPPKTLRAAVFEPFVGMFKKSRAPQILLFMVLYKLGENLATALIRPFLVEKGFPATDVGYVLSTISILTTVAGTLVGGLLTDWIGMGRTLWLSGMLQALGCLGYVAVDHLGGPIPGAGILDAHRWTMYGAIGIEQIFQGMGAGAQGVLMLRLTSKEFSATQFALLSSLMALPRVIVGPFAGVLVDALGWTPFFVLTVPIALPGLYLLARFVPFWSREPVLEEALPASLTPVGRRELVSLATLTALVSFLVGLAWSAFLDGMKSSRFLLRHTGSVAEWLRIIGLSVFGRLGELLPPHDPDAWIYLIASAVFGVVMALVAVGLVAARRGLAR